MKSKHTLFVVGLALLLTGAFIGGLFIANVSQEVQNRIIAVFAAGSIACLAVGGVLVGKGIGAPFGQVNRRLKETLHENYVSTKLLLQKDRELVAANRILEERNRELDETAKMLVRRDLELTTSNERLQELDEAKSQFVSVAAHQLRTPLSGIKWTLYTLMREEVGKINGEQRKLIRDAYKANERLIELIRNLLDVARLEEGRFGFELQEASLLRVVGEIKIKFQARADQKGITLEWITPEEKFPRLLIDEEKIAIALENLVDNAIKYSSPGGKVILRVSKEDDKVFVEIQDTGIGIPQEEISRIFTKFFRATNAQLFQTSGTGLGLYLAKNIIEHHGGTVYIKSKEEGGTTISFSLPVSSVAPKP